MAANCTISYGYNNWTAPGITVALPAAPVSSTPVALPDGSMPYALALSPNGTSIYVANFGSNTVSVIDTATNKITASVPVGSYPSAIAISPNGSKVYVANNGEQKCVSD